MAGNDPDKANSAQAPRAKAKDVDPRLSKHLKGFKRNANPDDALPADAKQMLADASVLGTNPELARKAKKDKHGRAYYLVPGTDSVALVNDAGVGMIDDIDHALSGQAISVQDCAGANRDAIRVVGLLPDGATGARITLVDGSVREISVDENVYVEEFSKTAMTLPRTVNWELSGQSQEATVPVPPDILKGTCGPPPGAE